MGEVFFVLLIAFILLSIRPIWVFMSCYFLQPRRIAKAMAKQGVYGPRPRVLIGNLLDISTLISRSTSDDMPSITHDIVDRLLPHYKLWSKLYGKRFVFWYGHEPRLCLTEVELIKEFLSSKNVNFSGRSSLQLEGSKHLIGRGLIMANGHAWCHQRRVLAPTFVGDRLKTYMGYVSQCTNQMLQTIADNIGDSGEVDIEIGGHMTRLAGDVISRAGFGSSYEKGQRIFKLLEKLQYLTARSSRYLWFPGSRLFPSKYRREIKELKEEIDGVLLEIIGTRKARVEIGRSSDYGDDFLGILLDQVDTKNTDLGLDLELVMDECKTMYFAGHESSALLLTWTIMLLATNPTWQEKARAEVAEVCRGEAPTMDHLSKLNVLHMIINESVRLYPPVPMLPRMAFEDMKLGDILIPKGLSVWIPVLAIHHDKQLWGQDADQFNPGRWNSRSFSQSKNYFPFASGPRNCVGQTFAVMEAKMVLAVVLKTYNLQISKNYRHAPVHVLTLKPKHGVPIKLTPLT